jgi:hypothetical protein
MSATRYIFFNLFPNVPRQITAVKSVCKAGKEGKNISRKIRLPGQKRKRYLPFYLLCACCLLMVPSVYAQAGQPAPDLFANGQVIQLAIEQPGMYKIDAAFLTRAGLNPAAIDPDHVHIFGQGGGMLPQPNNSPRPQGPLHNPVLVQGGGDGQFGPNDFVLFYAEGPDRLLYNPELGALTHEKNLYADQSYYYLKIINTPSPRPATDQSGEAGGPVFTQFQDYWFHEEDQVNLLARTANSAGSGRMWLGEIFEARTEYTFRWPATGLVPSGPAIFTIQSVANSPVNSRFQVLLNSQPLDSMVIPLVVPTEYGIKGRIANSTRVFTPTAFNLGNDGTFTVRYQRPAPSASGYLDFLSVQYTRALNVSGNQLIFRQLEALTHDHVSFRLGNASQNLVIWDITNPQQPAVKPYALQGQEAIFHAPGRDLRTFIAFSGSNFPNPFLMSNVPNQHLRALAVPNLLIISHPDFVPQAQRLANFRQTNDGLQAAVVTPQQIYHEFSSGRQDVTAIRDFIRHLYLRNPDPINGLRYVLLFGDASYDYKDRLPGNTNRVPTYQSRESMHPIFSFGSDDYFTFMQEEDGVWEEQGQIGAHLMDLGIGRLPVNTPAQATDVVNKLIRYSTSLGTWRKRLAFVADDGDLNIHQLQADQLAGFVEKNYPLFQVERLFIDAFPQVTSPVTGFRISPAVRDRIDQLVAQGTLLINYSGHGSVNGWASENILTQGQILQWANTDLLPLFLTATCEFGRFDDPGITSGAEFALLNPRGGAIGLLTTTRPVFSSTNFLLNKAFYDVAFEPVHGEPPRLGNIIRQTKNNSIQGVVNRNFSLLGDPSMRLAFPSGDVEVTHVNGQPVNGADTIPALSAVQLEGIIKYQGVAAPDFQGELEITVFDKPVERQTLGDEGPGTIMQFQNTEAVLFRGKASVENGRFTTRFVVPKNIDYRFGQGKVSFYAKNTQGTRDAGGAYENLVIGGSLPDPPVDQTPPQINILVGSENFRNGDRVNTNTTLIVRLFDESGIHISGRGLGQDLVAWLADAPENKWILNENYMAQHDDFQRGEVTLPLNGLKIGKHELTVRAWDNHNNMTEATVTFWVGNEVVIESLLCYPNPVNDQAMFVFTHNQPGQFLRAELQIFNATGAMVRKFTQNIDNAPLEVNMFEWDIRNDGMKPLENGLYFYKLYLWNVNTGQHASKSARLLIAQ